MLYQLYQAYEDAGALLRSAARVGSEAVWNARGEVPYNLALRYYGAVCDLIVGTTLTHRRPSFGIAEIKVGNRNVAIVEETAFETPFGILLRFRKSETPPQPRVLIVAPMSGHF